MQKVKIFVDSSSDMPEKYSSEYDITILPLQLIFDGKSYDALTELKSKEFYEMLENSTSFPTTSQVPYLVFYNAFTAALKEYDEIIYFSLSSKASGCYNTANMVKNAIAEEIGKEPKIHIFDSMSFSVLIASTAIHTSELLRDGTTVEDALVKAREHINNLDVYFLVDNLKYLEKGGRINKASLIIGTLLDIKPVLSIRDGLAEMVDKIRGNKKMFEKLVDVMKKNPQFKPDDNELMILSADSRENSNKLKQVIADEFGITKYYMEADIGPIIGAHTGRGSVALIFKKKH